MDLYRMIVSKDTGTKLALSRSKQCTTYPGYARPSALLISKLLILGDVNCFVPPNM